MEIQILIDAINRLEFIISHLNSKIDEMMSDVKDLKNKVDENETSSNN